MANRLETTGRRGGRGVLIGAVVVLVVAFGVRAIVEVLTRDATHFRPELAEAFFERYVEPDGRVVRRDQGSDSVSEGQAYAMLLAVALGDRSRFETVWRWTRRELQRPDGLLSWRWVGGGVADHQPAADADIDAAHALLLAGERFDEAVFLKESRRIATGVLDEETIEVGGRRFLVAGPWARDRRIVNPSYVAPEAFRRFAEAFGDQRWEELRRDSVAMMRSLTAGNRPPDWARLDATGTAVATTGPNASPADTSASGLESARVAIRFASSCDASTRALASTWSSAREGLEGAHPLMHVSASAAMLAAGDIERAEELLDEAVQVVRREPTYYGWAWVALGPAMLDAHALRQCRETND